MNDLIYKLELPPILNIYPVILVAALEPTPLKEDLYTRPREVGQATIFNNNNKDINNYFKIKYILDKRIKKLLGRGKRLII